MKAMKVNLLDRSDLTTESLAGHLSRPAYAVDFRHVGFPLSECLTATQGTVSPEILENLRMLGFDQAPVRALGNPTGWRVVSRDQLETLHRTLLPLNDDPSHYDPNDAVEVEGAYVPLPALFRAFNGCRA